MSEGAQTIKLNRAMLSNIVALFAIVSKQSGDKPDQLTAVFD